MHPVIMFVGVPVLVITVFGGVLLASVLPRRAVPLVAILAGWLTMFVVTSPFGASTVFVVQGLVTSLVVARAFAPSLFSTARTVLLRFSKAYVTYVARNPERHVLNCVLVAAHMRYEFSSTFVATAGTGTVISLMWLADTFVSTREGIRENERSIKKMATKMFGKHVAAFICFASIFFPPLTSSARLFFSLYIEKIEQKNGADSAGASLEQGLEPAQDSNMASAVVFSLWAPRFARMLIGALLFLSLPLGITTTTKKDLYCVFMQEVGYAKGPYSCDSLVHETTNKFCLYESSTSTKYRENSCIAKYEMNAAIKNSAEILVRGENPEDIITGQPSEPLIVCDPCPLSCPAPATALATTATATPTRAPAPSAVTTTVRATTRVTASVQATMATTTTTSAVAVRALTRAIDDALAVPPATCPPPIPCECAESESEVEALGSTYYDSEQAAIVRKEAKDPVRRLIDSLSCETLQTLILVFFPVGAHALSCYASLLFTYFCSKKQNHASYISVALLGPLAVGGFYMAQYHAQRQVRRQAQLDANRMAELASFENGSVAGSMSPLRLEEAPQTRPRFGDPNEAAQLVVTAV